MSTSTAMSRPARPPNRPPNIALPALPVTRSRKNSGPTMDPAGSNVAPATPKSGLRAPSAAVFPHTPSARTSALTQPRVATGVNATAKTLRKTVSINSFPHPPRAESRVTSMPPSPLSATASRKSKTLVAPGNASFSCGGPSLLNGTGEGKSVLRNSDGLNSVASPPQSRSSSTQDSYSTSATQYEDLVDVAQKKLGSAASTKRSSQADGKGNVIVSVRVRPDTAGKEHTTDGEWMVDGRESLIAYGGKEGGNHYYDNVFTTHDDNAKVYDHMAKRLVRRVMEGYHGTVFAYGMTSTGKTFSMQGTASSPGVIPLAITDIFSYIRETPSREFLLRVSYLEIYNEKIHDLLSMPTSTGLGAPVQEEIKLREDAKRGVYASPLKEEIVQSPTQLLRVIARGDQARRTASTQFNARSSRSHAVVQIVVESRQRISGGSGGENKRQALPPGGVRVSTLSLIDLAGSEKAAETKERRQEGSHINKSLLTLGTVIAKLSEYKDRDGKPADKDSKHLPYRDSKLTRLLQGALSGKSLVSILCTIQIGAGGSTASSPSTHTTETLNTLKFASRAKNNISSHAKRAEEALGGGGDGGARVLLERYRMEIVELRKQLELQQQAKKSHKDGEASDEGHEKVVEEERAREKVQEQRHEEQMLEMQLARTALKERIDHLNRLILSSKSIGVNASGSHSSFGMHSRFSTASLRSSLATPVSRRPSFERTASLTSSSSTIGRRSSGRSPRSSGGLDGHVGLPHEDESSLGEFGDGIASMAAQNRALQVDLADKKRYIQTLEKRLLQARRASSSRTSIGLSSWSGSGSASQGVPVGEDHRMAMLLRDKDAEIVELRARLDDKDKMLTALCTVAWSRDNADRLEWRGERRTWQSPTAPVAQFQGSPRTHRDSASSSTGGMNADGLSRSSSSSSPTAERPAARSLVRQVSQVRRRTHDVDEMSRMLDEMIQDRVETGQLARSTRGSVRVTEGPGPERPRPGGGVEASTASTALPPMQHPSPPVPVTSPPIQLQLLAKTRSPPPVVFCPAEAAKGSVALEV